MEKNSKTKLLALVLFIATEIMFFAGLLSAYWVLRSKMPDWPPPGQPRYPLAVTAINSLILLGSLVTFWKAEKKLELRQSCRTWLVVTAISGSLFLMIQGYEWFRLIEQGMGLVGNVYGALFYLIVGAHALHVFLGLLAIFYLLGLYFSEEKSITPLKLGKVYWSFVVLLWPFIYVGLYVV